MYKLLIVDDEEMIRVGILKTIPWTELEISEVKTAADGVEALTVFERFLPDIILTDIRMPGMNGLELLEQLHKIKAGVKVVILSGFDDFGYAKSALKLGAFDYLLKTSDVAELSGVVKNAISAIQKDREKERQFDKSMPLLRDKYLNQLVAESCDATEIYKELRQFAGVIFNDKLIVAVTEIDDFCFLSEKLSPERMQLLKSSVLEIARAELGNRGICFETNAEELVWIYNCDSNLSATENQDAFCAECKVIAGSVLTSLDISISIGLSDIGAGIITLGICYKQAKQALEYKLFAGKSCLIPFGRISNQTGINFQVAAAQERRLISAMRVADIKLVLETITDIFEQIRQCQNLRLSDFQLIGSDLLSIATRVLHEFNIEPADLFGKEFRYFEEIKKYKTFIEARQWVIEIFGKIALYILNNKILKNKRVIEQAKQYIAEHFHEDLTLNKVAEAVFMSPNYFSNLFSSEAGESFLEYLTALRIEKSKQLLGEKDAKAFEVGEKVGYDNPQYFSKIFKKYTGMTPSEYKVRLQNNR